MSWLSLRGRGRGGAPIRRAGLDELAGAAARRALLRDAGLVDDELSSSLQVTLIGS